MGLLIVSQQRNTLAIFIHSEKSVLYPTPPNKAFKSDGKILVIVSEHILTSYLDVVLTVVVLRRSRRLTLRSFAWRINMKFSYVDIKTKGCEGWLNLLFGEYSITLINNVWLANEIRKEINAKEPVIETGRATHCDCYGRIIPNGNGGWWCEWCHKPAA